MPRENETARPPEPPGNGRVATALVAAQFVALAALAVAGPAFRGPHVPVAARVAAAVFLAYGAWTGIAGMRALGRHLTPMPEPRAGGSLVTTGIYARIQHPLYACMASLGLAWASWWWSAAALAASAFLAGVLHAKARIEEARLAARFPGHDAYARRTPRYFPWPRAMGRI